MFQQKAGPIAASPALIVAPDGQCRVSDILSALDRQELENQLGEPVQSYPIIFCSLGENPVAEVQKCAKGDPSFQMRGADSRKFPLLPAKSQ